MEKTKVGNIVRIKTLKEFHKEGVYPELDWVSNAVEYCGRIAKISKVFGKGQQIRFKLEGVGYEWSFSELVFFNKLDVE